MAYRLVEDDHATNPSWEDNITSDLAARTARRNRYSPPLRHDMEDSTSYDPYPYSAGTEPDRASLALNGPPDQYPETSYPHQQNTQYLGDRSYYEPPPVGSYSAVPGTYPDREPISSRQNSRLHDASSFQEFQPVKGRNESTGVTVPSAYPSIEFQSNSRANNSFAQNSSLATVTVAPYAKQHIPKGEFTDFTTSWDASMIDVTFGSMKSAGPGAEDSNFLSFSALKIGALDISSFSSRFELENSKSSHGPLMIIIEGWEPWFLQDFRGTVSDFPLESLLYFGTQGGPAMLPLLDNEENELSCVLEHINTCQGKEESEIGLNFLDLGVTKANRQPLVLWTRRRGRITSSGYQPIIVMIGDRGHKLAMKIQQHYSDVPYKRWYRLRSNLTWSYLDTYFVLTKWDRIWSAIKDNMRRRSAELQGQEPAPSLLRQTRRLHEEANLIISLREHLRIHKASVKRIILGVREKTEPTDLESRKSDRVLQVRLEDTFQLLEYYEVTACSLLDQQQNLLSLAFNTETVSQGQSVARLNALAFIFLPLSFSASIWGITTFTVDAAWYPAFALPLLVVTIALAAAANAILSNRDSRPLSSVVKTPTVKRGRFWEGINFGAFWPRPSSGQSSYTRYAQTGNDPEKTSASAPSVPPPPTATIPFGMSPAYGLGAPPAPTPTFTSPVELSATAGTTALPLPIQRSSSLRSQRSFSWKKGEDDLGGLPNQEHPTESYASTSFLSAPPPSPVSSVRNSLQIPNLRHQNTIGAFQPVDHTTLETIPEINTPLVGNAPGGDPDHTLGSDIDFSDAASSSSNARGKRKETAILMRR